jgi:hypothetical protein
MTESEINYFLDGVETKQGLIESIESLRDELRRAMAPLLVPVYKDTEKEAQKQNTEFDSKRGDSIAEEQDFIYESDLNQYEKAVLLFMHHTTYAQSTNDIAKACSISTASVKRVVSKHMMSGTIMRAPFEPGYILTKFKNQ